MRIVAKYGQGMGMDHIGADALFVRLDAKRDDLVALTQDLVRIPTVNPPGENYRDICEFLARRLERSGFTAAIERAEGTPGDSDRIGRLDNCIAYGPGLLELAHKPDEYVVVQDMMDSAKVMGLCLMDLLTTQRQARA